MGEASAVDTTRAGRRIIERPRLTRLLTESESRVMLLVAPAGYGKTTLARQWLRDRKHAWYQATPASSDVAALALGLASAANAVVPGSARRLRTQLKATTDRATVGSVIAEELSRELAKWPDEARFVIDDYQLISGSPPPEGLIEWLVSETGVPFLIVSRERPSWVTAKKLLYGEVREFGRTTLAMTHDEAATTLEYAHGEMPGLVSLAEGWPAVIGLAALLRGPAELSVDEVPETLHQFFAEELYQGIDRELQWALIRISLADSLDRRVMRSLLGEDSASILESGCRCGFLTRSHHGYEMHPLLRQFLRTKIVEFDATEVATAAEVLAQAYIEYELWDEAIAVAEECQLPAITLDVLQRALEETLSNGRVATVERWVELARTHAPTASVVRLAEIEVAFRTGNVATARDGARQLARTTRADDPLASRIYLRAGQISHLDDRLDEAVAFFARAEKCATGPSDLRHAVWSRFVSLTDLDDRAGASEVLETLERLPSLGVNDFLRARQGRLQWALRWGGVTEALDATASSLSLVDRSEDPFVRTGFLQTYAVALILAARYSEAANITCREIEEAQRFKLDWVVPHALETQASALVGQRDFQSALRTLAEVGRTAAGNAHTELNVDVLKARVHLSNGAPERAVALLDGRDGAATSPGMQGDFLATFGTALICSRRIPEGIAALDAAEEVTTHLEARTLGAFGRVIAAHLAEPDRAASEELRHACAVANETGNFDAFVTAYRACPDLLKMLSGLGEGARGFREIACQIDSALSIACGLMSREQAKPSNGALTRREHEVLQLVSQGLSNRQIARTLWIAESTVKVHVRHLFEKLGVQSRTEAAAKAAEVLGAGGGLDALTP